MSALGPEKALIFRMTHVANVPWTLDHGLHCRNSPQFDPNFRNIGNPDLISRRHHRIVPIEPGGTLSDYVPFYFTPFSIMLYNIKTGYGGVPHVPNNDIVILVSSLWKAAELGGPFVFTNQHAYPMAAEFFNRLEDLHRVDWRFSRRATSDMILRIPERRSVIRPKRLFISILRSPRSSASHAIQRL